MSEPKDTTSTKVRVVQLKDVNGIVQTIFPIGSMLDVSTITRMSKRRLRPVLSAKEHKSAVLNSNNTITYIDDALRHKKELTFLCKDDHIEEIKDDALDMLFSGVRTQFSNIAIPLKQIPTEVNNHLNDEGQMLQALGRFQSIQVRQRLEQTLELPPLPISSQRILRLCADSNAGTDQLCEVINLDPSLSAQVVSWASSPYYAAPGKIKSVEDAIIRVLGFDMVMNLALGLSMGKALETPKNGPKHYKDYWFNAVFFASLMAAITEELPSDVKPSSGHAYLAGLLHNFGYLTISAILPSHFVILSRYLEANTHLPAYVIEMQLLRLTSEQIGTWLLRHWSLPNNICDGIRYHRNTNYDGNGHVIATMLNVCHRLVNNEPISEGCLNKLKTTNEKLQEILADINDTSDNLKRMAALIKR